MSTEACEFLRWDTEFFGCRIARVNGDYLCESRLRDVFGWCDDHAIDCLYFLADGHDPVTVRVAEKNQFNLVDVRLILETAHLKRLGRKLNDGPELVIRPSTATDVPALREIARTNHRDSRFYFDSHFRRGDCDRLFETWIERSCSGYADIVFVAELDSVPAGYVSCHQTANGTGSIGLLGVREQARGRRLGQQLVENALCWFADQNAERATVVTQARNIAAQRLYQRCGFVTSSTGLFYHRWFE